MCLNTTLSPYIAIQILKWRDKWTDQSQMRSADYFDSIIHPAAGRFDLLETKTLRRRDTVEPFSYVTWSMTS